MIKKKQYCVHIKIVKKCLPDNEDCTLLQTEPSLEAQGDSSRTLSSNKCRIPCTYGAVAREGRLYVLSTCGCVQLIKLKFN